MAEIIKRKSNNSIILIIVIIVIIAVVFGIYKLKHNNNDDNGNLKEEKIEESLEISDSDPREVKIEKIQKKLEIINQEIDKVQEKLNVELKKKNDLNSEYMEENNKHQTVVPATEEDMREAEENMKEYLESQDKAK